MSRRDTEGKFARRHSLAFIAGTWIGSFVSLGILYLTGAAVTAELSGFRSCSSNNSGLQVVNCGKQSLNFGDVVLIVLFILSAALAVTMFTAAWRTIRQGK